MLRTGRMLYQSAGSSRERERRVIRHLRPHIGERDDRAVAAARSARDPADLPSFVEQRRVVFRNLVELDDAEAAVRMATEVKACHRLLARITALREGDVRVLETGLGRKDAVVELPLPARHAE